MIKTTLGNLYESRAALEATAKAKGIATERFLKLLPQIHEARQHLADHDERPDHESWLRELSDPDIPAEYADE